MHRFAVASLFALAGCSAEAPSTTLDASPAAVRDASPDAACPRPEGLGSWPLVVCDTGREGVERFASVEVCAELAGLDVTAFGVRSRDVAASCTGPLDAACRVAGVRVCSLAEVRAALTRPL